MTAGELLETLTIRLGDRVRPPSWPKTPRGAAGQVRRAAPALRKLGIDITCPRNRLITIRKRSLTTVPTVTHGPDSYGYDGRNGQIPPNSNEAAMQEGACF